MKQVQPFADKLLLPTIPVGFLDDVIQAPRYRGIDITTILSEQGLTEALLKTSGMRVSVEKYSHVLRALRDATDDAFLGFLSRPIPADAFRVFCYSLPGCRTVEELIAQCNDFYGLFIDEFRWTLTDTESALTIQIDLQETYPIDYRFIITSLMLMTIRLFGWLLGEDVEPELVKFTFTENTTDKNLTYLFGRGIAYGAERNLIVFKRRYSKAKLSCTRDQIREMLKSTRNLFLISRRKYPLSQEVRRLLLSSKHDEWLEVDEVAQSLGINPHQLWRKLKAEGSSFLEIRDQIKRDWALVLLEDPSTSVEMVANQLRYSEASAFRKAFKKWTGLQPLQYRELLS
ncbi:MAG: AraC family transcriptional regulator [Candidatus Pelagadaptatus aseana]|uniref:AraC family transcriptional regulator n=1 Tax=Candidatus Pelagadaptatus aseana TaxID=3120508 RepID=UPI0039B1C509